MNKDIFLAQLEKLLYEIPKEERDEAMEYYRSYFDDAGLENEAAVLEDLGSPQQIAASIKEGLNNSGDVQGFLKNPPQVKESQQKREESQGMAGSQGEGREPFGEAYKRAGNSTGSGKRYSQYDNSKGMFGSFGKDKIDKDKIDKKGKLILLIIIIAFTVPLWGTIASGALGIICVLIAAVIAVGILAVGGIIGGIACTILAVIKFFTLSLFPGLVLLGAGMLLIAGSGLGIVLLLLLCGRFLPWAIGLAAQLFGKLLAWGRSMA